METNKEILKALAILFESFEDMELFVNSLSISDKHDLFKITEGDDLHDFLYLLLIKERKTPLELYFIVNGGTGDFEFQQICVVKRLPETIKGFYFYAERIVDVEIDKESVCYYYFEKTPSESNGIRIKKQDFYPEHMKPSAMADIELLTTIRTDIEILQGREAEILNKWNLQ